MLSKIKKLVVSAALVMSLAVPLALPATVSAADINGNLCSGATNQAIPQNGGSTSQCTGSDNTATKSVNSLITEILNVLSAVVGIIAVIMIIVGGFHYITSGGSQEKVKKAKDTLLYAIIGLIIVALAQIIVKFVLNKTISSSS